MRSTWTFELCNRGGNTVNSSFISKSLLRQVNDLYIEEGFESNLLKPIPSRIFKFTSVNEFVVKNTENDEISFSKVKTFNDYDDSISISKKIVFEMLKQHNLKLESDFKKIFPNSDEITLSNDAAMKQIANTEFKNLQSYGNNLMVCCLSEGNNQSYMWGHYGDSNRGIAIEYETDSFLEDTLIGVTYSPNYYSNKTNSINFFDDDESIENIIYLNIFLKSNQWSFEEEHRIVLSLPFLNENYLSVKFRKPKSIILGKRFFEDFINEKDNKINQLKRTLLDTLCNKDIKIQYVDSNEQGYVIKNNIVNSEIQELSKYFEKFEENKISSFQLEEIIERVFHTSFEYI